MFIEFLERHINKKLFLIQIIQTKNAINYKNMENIEFSILKTINRVYLL